MAWGPVPASLLAAGAACYFGMRAAWRQKATVPFKAAYVGMCLLGGSGAVLLALPEEDSTRCGRSATPPSPTPFHVSPAPPAHSPQRAGLTSLRCHQKRCVARSGEGGKD